MGGIDIKGKKCQVISIIVLYITFVSLLYIFMSYDIKMKISSPKASVRNNNWSLKFKSLSSASIKGYATEVSRPTINGDTAINNLNVEFDGPNSQVTYSFKVVNDGEIDAKLSDYTISKQMCKSVGVMTREQIDIACNNIKFDLTMDGKKLTKGVIIPKKSQKSIVLTISYVGKEMPKQTILINNRNIKMVFIQN